MVSVKISKDFDSNKISIDEVEAELLHTYYGKDPAKKRNFKVYPYTKLTDSILSNHDMYYNRYMNIVTADKDFIKRGDYSGNSK